jgi:flagellar protein FliS
LAGRGRKQVNATQSDSIPMYGNTASPFAPRSQRASMYSKVGLETDVQAASPHRLVSMLFDGVFDAMSQALGAIASGNTELKNRSISRAVRILDEGLKSALNLEAGPLATDLRDLYAFVCMRLTQANLHADPALIEECQRLLGPIREAWNAIGNQPEAKRAA